MRKSRKKQGAKLQIVGAKLLIKSLTKIVVLLLIIGLNWTGLSAVIETFAYFNDTETASENSFSASTLDFSLTNTDVEKFIGVELGEDIEFISVATKMTGSLGIQYKVHAEKISGNDDFCNALQLEAFHSLISYDGALLSFDTAATTALGTWAFEIKLPHTATHIAHGEECNVDLVFKGWRQDVADFNQSGFTDEERIQLRLTSRMIVLNEFLPKPNGEAYEFDFGNDSSDMPKGEWVELYNNSDFAFDLSGWYIKDSLESDTNKIMITGSNTIPAGTTIDLKSWLVIYMNKAVLDNTGDTVRLFDNNNTLVDSYTYTAVSDYCEIEPTPGDENSYTTGGGSCGEVPPNKSYARIPDGIGYWVDPIPTPGGPNIDDNKNYLLSQQQIEPKDDITFSELVEEFIDSNGGAGDLTEIITEPEQTEGAKLLEELMPAESEPEPEIETLEPIIETTTPSDEPVLEEPEAEEGANLTQEEPAEIEGAKLLEESEPELIIEEQPANEEEPVDLPDNGVQEDDNPEPEENGEGDNEDNLDENNIENEQNNNEQEENI